MEDNLTNEEMDEDENLVWFQQGDVTIKPVSEIPGGAKRVGGRVLREGEATGHAHRVTAADVLLFLHEGTLYMRAPAGTEVVHEEHKALSIPPGDYVIGAVREFDHFAEQTRFVVD